MVMVVEIMVVILRFFWDSSLGKRDGVRMKLRKEEQGKLKNGQLDVMPFRGI